MRSGSPADEGGRPSAQHPYGDEPTSGPGPYGAGRRGEPQQGRSGSGEVPFGPDISWPNGFRQLDTDSRRLLESGYGSGRYPSGGYSTPGNSGPGYGTGQYDRVDPGYGRRQPGGPGDSGYWPPAMDDTGYGDPGYSDPSYEDPHSAGDPALPPSGGRATGGYGQQPGYQVPDYREPVRPEFGYQQGYVPPLSAPAEIYPVTGAQEILPETSPQPGVGSWGRSDQAASTAYPEQWYDHPRLDTPPAPDPRLAGMRYDELRYEDSPAGYDEPLDDDSWMQELRRSAPSYPQTSPGPSDPAPRRTDSPRGFGPQPGSGSQSGLGQQPGRPSGFGSQSGFQRAPGREQPPGYGPARDDRNGPRMRTETGSGRRAAPGGDVSAAGFLAAPVAPVGLLTPPAVRPAAAPAEHAPLMTGPQVLAAPDVQDAPETRQFQVIRPGHGLDGPSITSSWPAQPQAEEVESYEDFWREDEDDDYRGLFPDEDGEAPRARRSTGRRRGRSNDHRLWLALLVVIVTAGAAIFGIIKFEFPSHGGPAHSMVIPARIGSYIRTVNLEKQTHLAQLRAEVITMSSGHASSVVSAAYESGNSAAGATEQIIMFIGGHL